MCVAPPEMLSIDDDTRNAPRMPVSEVAALAVLTDVRPAHFRMFTSPFSGYPDISRKKRQMSGHDN